MSLGREGLISRLISTPEGRLKLAASMVRPTRCGGKNYPPPSCSDCGMPESEFVDGHLWQDCTVYRVMES